MMRDEIMAMKPGRELDALVYGMMHGGTIPKEGNNRYNMMPRYSTDIAAAWQVVEKWFKAYYYGTFELNCAQFGNEVNWECQFGNNARASGETAPETICKAALLVVCEEATV